MGDIGLLHRADCHANGVAAVAAWVADPNTDTSPIGLCRRHLHVAAEHLTRLGWVIERVDADDDCDTVLQK